MRCVLHVGLLFFIFLLPFGQDIERAIAFLDLHFCECFHPLVCLRIAFAHGCGEILNCEECSGFRHIYYFETFVSVETISHLSAVKPILVLYSLLSSI